MELKNLIASSETVDIYREGDKAVKIFKTGRKTDALYEALTHARIEYTDLLVPTIHEVSVIDGHWAITMDLIEGDTLEDLMKKHPENADRYLEDMVDLQLKVHQEKMPKLSKLKDKLTRLINSLDTISDSIKYELLTRLDSMPKHVKLCHGNFVPANIIINDKGTYIVDWIAARQGNASADVAKTYLLLSLQSPEMAEKYPIILTTGGRKWTQFHSEWRQVKGMREIDPWPVLTVNPETAKEYGISEGDWAEVFNDTGKARLKVKVSPVIKPGMVHATHAWWFPEQDGEAPNYFGAFKSNINTLLPNDSCGRMYKGSPYKSNMCNIRRVTGLDD